MLNVSFDRPALILGPEAPVLQPGGTLTLPLLEYADRLPLRSVVPGGQAEPLAAPDPASKGTPAGPVSHAVLALGIAALALARRRDRLL